MEYEKLEDRPQILSNLLTSSELTAPVSCVCASLKDLVNTLLSVPLQLFDIVLVNILLLSVVE